MNTQNEQQQPEVTTSSSQLILKLSVLVCFLIAVGALGFCLYVWQQLQQSSQQQYTAQQQVEQIQQQLSVTDDAVDKQQDKLSNQQVIIKRLAAQTDQRDRTLVLAEAEYLTRLANFSLQFEHNVPQAIQLLETANKRLQSLSDPTLMKIRGVLTEDITKLQAVPNADIPGILLKLNALTGRINKLPLLLTKNEDSQDKTTSESNASGQQSTPNTASQHQTQTDTQQQASKPSIWRRGWDKTWSSLKSIVVIKHGNDSKLITPTDRDYIDQHLQSLLAQAQWALIRHQQKLYSNSIKQAESWTKQYYDGKSQQTKAMINSLQQLANVNVQPKVPDLSHSLELIRQALNQTVGQMTAQS